ncbi:MAG: hypothetical protein ACLSB9_38210 [Hydrogeniiclostridium mannosilyticum]
MRPVFLCQGSPLLTRGLKTGVEQPDSFEDYDVTLDTLPGLACEIIDGV